MVGHITLSRTAWSPEATSRLWELGCGRGPGAQPRQRQRRVGPAGDHRVELRWQMGQQEGDGLVDLLGPHRVVVVRDQAELVGQGRHLVDQGRHHGFAGGSGR
jgi:hypothetical protein